MAKYRLLAKSFIDNHICEEGEEIVVDDELVPGPHMKPLDAAAKAAIKKADVTVGEMPDIIVELTGGVDTIGASPQGVRSGIAASDVQMP
jgi:hypothetical protein